MDTRFQRGRNGSTFAPLRAALKDYVSLVVREGNSCGIELRLKVLGTAVYSHFTHGKVLSPMGMPVQA